MLYVPVITPFAADGAVAWPAFLQALAHDLLADGATGLVALGTTAEPASLTSGERRDVLDLLAAVCREHQAPLIVGANDPDQLRVLADRPAVRAALSLVPPFLRPGEEGAIAHLQALAAQSPVPLIVYHVPYRTAQPLTAAALHRLAATPAITGIKFAPGAIDPEAVAFRSTPPPISPSWPAMMCCSPRCWPWARTAASSPPRHRRLLLRRADHRMAGRRPRRRPPSPAPPGRALRRPVRRAEPDRDQSRPARRGPHPHPRRPPTAARGLRTDARASAEPAQARLNHPVRVARVPGEPDGPAATPAPTPAARAGPAQDLVQPSRRAGPAQDLVQTSESAAPAHPRTRRAGGQFAP